MVSVYSYTVIKWNSDDPYTAHHLDLDAHNIGSMASRKSIQVDVNFIEFGSTSISKECGHILFVVRIFGASEIIKIGMLKIR